jgi:ankyrin repeat protein
LIGTKEIFSKKTEFRETSLMFAAENDETKTFENVWNFVVTNFSEYEQRKILLEENSNGWTDFHYATKGESKESFEIARKIYVEKFGIEKLKEILVKKSRNGDSILHFAVSDQNEKANENTVKALCDFMQQLLDDEAFKLIVQTRNENGKNVVEFCSKDPKMLKVLEEFC